jgi:hypothetical protein
VTGGERAIRQARLASRRAGLFPPNTVTPDEAEPAYETVTISINPGDLPGHSKLFLEVEVSSR